MSHFYLILIVFSLSMATHAQAQLPLLPMPAQVVLHQGHMPSSGALRINLDNCRDPIAASAAKRLAGHGRGFVLNVHCEAGVLGDESYTLTVTPAGAELRARSGMGALRGMATFRQLAGSNNAPAVVITDRPRFAWRGLMIDVSRHFLPIDVLRRQLDIMESVKLNVLHLHLTDAQGFRVESKLYPKLHQEGSGGEFYKQEEIRELIVYARERGIRIVPEFDVPGHSKSWLIGYPQLGASSGPYRLTHDTAVNNAVLDPSKEEVYQFLDRLFGEMAALFPDRYFHIGGDEVNGIQWNQSAQIQAFMKRRGMKDNRALQAYFTGRVHEILARHGKTMIGWDELMNGKLPRDVVVQTWRSANLAAVANANANPVIASAGYYLDWFLPASFHYAIDPADAAGFGFTPQQAEKAKQSSLKTFVTEEMVLRGAKPPVPVIGAEATLFTEMVTSDLLNGRLWPRMAAIAERFWSPANVRDAQSMYRRLEVFEARLGMEAPADPFVGAVEPVKFYGRLLRRLAAMRKGAEGPLDRLADTLPAESMIAREFHGDVRQFLRGQGSAEPVKSRLAIWARVAAPANQPELRELAEDIRTLTAAGLDALEKRTTVRDYSALLEKHRKAAAASAGFLESFMNPQPPSELLIAIAPAVEDLLSAAKH